MNNFSQWFSGLSQCYSVKWIEGNPYTESHGEDTEKNPLRSLRKKLCDLCVKEFRIHFTQSTLRKSKTKFAKKNNEKME